MRLPFLISILMLCLAACAAKQSGLGDTPLMEGDVAIVDFEVRLEDGALIATSQQPDAGDVWAKGIEPSVQRNVPEAIVAGRTSPIEHLKDLVLGMRIGESGTTKFPRLESQGERDPEKVKTLSRTTRIAGEQHMPISNYVKSFNTYPAIGNSHPFRQGVVARVADVEKGTVKLQLALTQDFLITRSGTYHYNLVDGDLVTTFDPIVGAPYSADYTKGYIIATDEDSFTVDLNPPLAEKPVVFKYTIREAYPADHLAKRSYNWVTDIDKGLALAKAQGKPAVLILKSSECKACKQYFDTTLADPRIKVLSDRFVWIRIDANGNKDIQKRFKLKFFPLTIVFDSNGNQLERIDGLLKKSTSTLWLKLARTLYPAN